MKTPIPKVRVVQFKESKVLGFYNPQLKLILVSRTTFFTLTHEIIHHIANLIDKTENCTIYEFVSDLIDKIL